MQPWKAEGVEDDLLQYNVGQIRKTDLLLLRLRLQLYVGDGGDDDGGGGLGDGGEGLGGGGDGGDGLGDGGEGLGGGGEGLDLLLVRLRLHLHCCCCWRLE
jgi:hypothetical protein